MRLEIALTPRALHGGAPRTLISAASWRRISARVREAGKCIFCGSEKNLHAHEEYGIRGSVARLSRVICVCGSCHDVIHIGRMFAIGQQEKAVAQLMKVSRITRMEAEAMIDRAFRDWEKYPDRMILDWSHLAQTYGDLMNDGERAASLMSKAES